MLNQTGGSRTDTVVKLVLIFFISLLFFSVGTFVGKQVSDSDYKKQALEEEFNTGRATASIDTDAYSQETPDNALSEEDIESLTEEFVNAEKSNTQGELQKADDIVETDKTVAGNIESVETKDGYKQFTSNTKTIKTPSAVEKKQETPVAKNTETQRNVASAANRVAQGLAPIANPPKTRKPDSVLPSIATSSVGKYTVQIASYATEQEAQSHVSKLKTKGYSAFYLSANVRNRNWYRVSVGLFSDHNSAKTFRKELMKQAGIKSSIIQKIVR